MRPKVVAAIFLLAFVMLGTMVFLSRPARSEPRFGDTANSPAEQTTASRSPLKMPTDIISNGMPAVAIRQTPTVTASRVVQETNRAVYVRDRIAELMALGMNNDSNSLNTIWGELANPDKEIRAGALAAVVQFGDRSVVPNLRELAAQTQDATEKAEIIKAADFLDLPSLTEVRRQATNGP
jgi:hypothetical protein